MQTRYMVAKIFYWQRCEYASSREPKSSNWQPAKELTPTIFVPAGESDRARVITWHAIAAKFPTLWSAIATMISLLHQKRKCTRDSWTWKSEIESNCNGFLLLLLLLLLFIKSKTGTRSHSFHVKKKEKEKISFISPLLFDDPAVARPKRRSVTCA